MPIYEYKCQKCGSVFELIQKFSDDPLTQHKDCGGEVERLISSSALMFKGSGFYITDYAKSGSKAAGKDGGSKDGDGAPAASKSSDSGASKSGESGSKDSGSKDSGGSKDSSSTSTSAKSSPGSGGSSGDTK